jgi:hypothetical protein
MPIFLILFKSAPLLISSLLPSAEARDQFTGKPVNDIQTE